MMNGLLLMTLSAMADSPPEFGVTIEPLVAADLQHENKTEDTVESWTWIRARAKHRTANSEWFFGARAIHHVRHGVDTESLWEIELGETGIAGSSGSLYGRAGNLIERWGKLDMTPVLDVFNPRDLTAGPLGTIESARLPTPMAVLEATAGSGRVEVIYAPFPESDRIQTEGSDWSLIRPGMLNDTLTDAATWQGESAALLSEQIAQLGSLANDVSPSTVRKISSSVSDLERPEQTGLNGNAGLRISMEGAGFDAAVMGANLTSSIPETTLNPMLRAVLDRQELPAIDDLGGALSSPPIETTWPRSWLVGTEASTVVGPMGVRAEAAWWSNKVVQQPWFNATTSAATAAGLGIDWAYGTTVFVSMEGRWLHLLDPPDVLVFTAANTIECGGTIRVSAAADTVGIILAGLWNPTFNEGIVRPEVQWRVSDPVHVSIGAVVIDGPSAPPRTLNGALRYRGGPLSLASENDVVFASLRWIQ